MSLDLPQAVRSASAIRFELALQPPGGSTQKIFPPTYPAPRNGGREVHAEYATEQRLIGGEQADVALLDSIPSQANRLEQALLTAHKTRDLPLPVVQVAIDGYGTITDLDAPHRVYDAILIDSLLDGQPFLKSSVGSQVAAATTGNATALFRYAPTTLIFGAWNTHSGQRVGMARFPRALASEIIGWPIVPGIKTASRIDPLGILKSAGDGMFKTDDGRWTFSPERALKEKNKPVPAKPSEIGHGNVAPSLDRETGGISVNHVRQTAVLTLVQLRNLHFPDEQGRTGLEQDRAAQTVLAALAVVALMEQWEQGYQLRSGCLLQPLHQPTWYLCGRTAEEDASFTLTTTEAHALLRMALEEAARHALHWPAQPLTLVASPDLQELVKRNVALVTTSGADEE